MGRQGWRNHSSKCPIGECTQKCVRFPKAGFETQRSWSGANNAASDPAKPLDHIMTADDALFSTTTRAILRLLFAPASRGYHLREIARCCGLGLGQLQRELARLCACGVLERSIPGNRHRFRANRDSPLFEDIAHLVASTFGIAHDLRCALAPVLGRIDLALIYGAAARADYASLPCIDLPIVGGLEHARSHSRKPHHRRRRSSAQAALPPRAGGVRPHAGRWPVRQLAADRRRAISPTSLRARASLSIRGNGCRPASSSSVTSLSSRPKASCTRLATISGTCLRLRFDSA